MNLHEYQAKQLLLGFDVPLPRGRVADQPSEAAQFAAELGKPVVVKAQIHAGGRGQGGGVKLASTPAEAEHWAARILGMTLVTRQTGPEGRVVRRILVEETQPIARELYLALAVDRSIGRPIVIAAASGGMEIEEIAVRDPAAIQREAFDPDRGLLGFQARRLVESLRLPAPAATAAAVLISALSRAFVALDAALLEINPLALTSDNRLVALDAKLRLDDNALFRHPELKLMRDLNEESPLEVEASKYNLNYIKLDGSIGCMVNGAGLAMATMDIIQYSGGRPANFLDVGGGASQEQVRHAFEILLQDSAVRAILINIFGGILRCDTLASGVVAAARAVDLRLPLIMRMEGTNVEQGREILRASGLPIILADSLRDAAEKAVAAARV